MRAVPGTAWATFLLFLALCPPVQAGDASAGKKPPPLQNTIRWSTASEQNNFGFDVYRSDSRDGPFRRLTKTPVEGGLDSDAPRQYKFVDDTIETGKTYYYYVESISLDNKRERFTPVQASKPK